MYSTPLSGNELFCLARQGYSVGNFVCGNSVYSLAYLETLGTGFKTTVGKELRSATEVAAQGWKKAYQMLLTEAKQNSDAHIISIIGYPKHYPGHIEFYITGSVIHGQNKSDTPPFTSNSNGQELYADLDAGYRPISFVWGNAVYSTGLSQTVSSNIKTWAQSEIKTYSEYLNQTRQAALERLKQMATVQQANAVIGIKIFFLPFGKAGEILMTGTASQNDRLPTALGMVTSDLSAVEVWNLAQLGYVPLALVHSTAIYSLGITGSAVSRLQAFIRGERPALASLLQEARSNLLMALQEKAKEMGADEIVGVKITTYSLGNGLIDFFALGTAVKKMHGVKTESQQLLPQVMVQTETNYYHGIGNVDKGSPLSGIMRILLIIFIILFLVWLAMKGKPV